MFGMKSCRTVRLLSVSILFLLVVSLSAQTPSRKEALAGELLDFLHVDKTLDAVFAAMPKIQQQVLDAQKLSPEQKEKVRQQVQATMDTSKKSLTWDAIRPMYVKIYADNFDQAELEGIIPYYKSPVGQKRPEKQPVVQAATVQVMTDIIVKIQAAAADASKQSDDRTETKPTATP